MVFQYLTHPEKATRLPLACLVLVVTVLAAPNSRGQQTNQMKVEPQGCREPAAHVGDLHPADKFKVCIHFVSDQATGSHVTAVFQLQAQGSDSRGGAPRLASTFGGNTLLQAATSEVEVEITVPQSVRSGDFALSDVVASNDKYGSYDYPLDNEAKRLTVTVRNSDDYKFPAIRNIHLNTDGQ